MKQRWLAASVGGLLLFGAACRPADVCAEPADACGGDPVGQWTLVDSCQDPTLPDMAIAKRTTRNQPVVTAGQPPPEPASTDWCADLVYGPSGIDFLNLPRDTPKLLGAYLSYASTDLSNPHATGSWGALVTTSDTTSIDFSRSCIERFGYSATCQQFGVDFATFGTTLGGVKETSCGDDGSGGCLCRYTIEADAAGTNLSGAWAASGSTITHFPSNMVLPSEVDFCVQGSRMTLWGHDRTSILDIAGARTMSFEKIVCGDGRVDRGEQCDPPDGVTCSDACQRIGP